LAVFWAEAAVALSNIRNTVLDSLMVVTSIFSGITTGTNQAEVENCPK
jgi:hypothetical protein